MTTYFCDGLKEVTLLNGVARLEFYRLEKANPSGPDGGFQPLTEFVVALPVQGFMQALSQLEQIRDRLARESTFPATVSGAAGRRPPP
jgi:hypothetical protein